MKSIQKVNDITYNGIDINEMVKKLSEERSKILNEFSKAYLAETGVMPSEIELVCQEKIDDKTIEHIYFFRKKVLDSK
jgi:hypothetical protein